MNITSFSLKKNVLVISIMIVIIFSGISLFDSMPRDDMPPFLVRMVSIVTIFPGASPDRVEKLVSDKIEKKLQEVPEVDYITSENRTDISIVYAFIKDSESDLQPIYDRLRRKVEQAKQLLPPDVYSVDFEDEGMADVFGILIGLTAEGFNYVELKEVADDIRNDIIKLHNASKVEVKGFRQERVFVEYNNARLVEVGLTPTILKNIISSTNIIFAGGNIKIGDERIILEPTGNFESIEDIKKIIVLSKQGETLFLGDIADIYRAYVEPRQSIVRINSKRGLVISVNVKKGGNIISLGQEVRQVINKYKQTLPWGFKVERIVSQDLVVEKSVKDFQGNLIQAVVVVLLVMLFFLGIRTGLVVASLIPMTIAASFLLMAIFDVGLNKVSLASLIIALGMLVDNAIVVSEAILVKMENGEKATDAAISSSKELFIPLLTSSLTTSAAFLSFFLAESVMGEIMGELFLVVSFALFSSWLISMTIIPMLCVYFLKVKKTLSTKKSVKKNRLEINYLKLLKLVLSKRLIFISIIILLFIISLWAFQFLPFIFMPHSERPLVTATIDLPLGSTIEKTEQVIANIEKFLVDSLSASQENKEGVESYSSFIGEGAPKYDIGYQPPEQLPSSAHILINTTSDKANSIVIKKLDSYIQENLPEVKAKVKKLTTSGGNDNPVEVRISGENIKDLYRITETVKNKMQSIQGIKNIRDDWGPLNKKIIVQIDQTRAQMAGLTSQDIALSLQTSLSGIKTGQFREGEKVIPIFMRQKKSENKTIGDLESMNIFSQMIGVSVPLKQVADLKVVWEATKIKRRDLRKTITISAGFKEGFTAAAITAELQSWLEREKNNWAESIKYDLGGEAEDTAKNMGAVIKYIPLSLFIIILLLIGQFNSIRKTLIILFTIPLGLIGVIFGLLIANSSFGFMAFLGVISLIGIVINNAIVLIDRIQIEINEFNKTPYQAILDSAIQRFRPIALTTATTSLGLIPLWIGGGLMWQPMAITIMFGLLFATVLTLLFVPVLYSILFRVKVV